MPEQAKIQNEVPGSGNLIEKEVRGFPFELLSHSMPMFHL